MSKSKIIYLHGYGSSPSSEKVKSLQEHFDVYAPNVPLLFDEAFESLITELKNLKSLDVVLVGTSLGGYWASLLSEMFKIPAIIINPSCSPNKTLAKYKNVALTDLELSKYKDLDLKSSVPRIVLLAEDDEILDYRIAEQLFKPIAEVKLFESGGHRFNEVEIIAKYIIELQNYSIYLP